MEKNMTLQCDLPTTRGLWVILILGMKTHRSFIGILCVFERTMWVWM